MNEHREIEGLGSSTEHEELVRQVLLGETPMGDEVVRRLEHGCPPCSRQLKEHAQISALLNEGGAFEMQSILEEALAADEFPGDEQVDEILRSLAGDQPLSTPRGERWRFRPISLLVAAAVILLAVLANRSFNDSKVSPTGATHLGPAGVESESAEEAGKFGPAGSGADFSRVHWNLQKPETGLYLLRVYDNTDGSRGELLFTKELQEAEWRPTKTDKERLTSEVLFLVEARDAADVRLGPSLSWQASSGSE